MLFAILAHTSGIDYRTVANSGKLIEKLENDLAKIKSEMEDKIQSIMNEQGAEQIKGIFNKIFGTDVEKFSSDWQELQAAVGHLEQSDPKVQNKPFSTN